MPDIDPYYEWLGIPLNERPVTHYRLLGLREGESNPKVIENAADRVMGFLRQRTGGVRGNIATQLLNEVAQSRLVLLDAKRKADYDRRFRRQEPTIARRPPVPSGNGAATPPDENGQEEKKAEIARLNEQLHAAVAGGDFQKAVALQQTIGRVSAREPSRSSDATARPAPKRPSSNPPPLPTSRARAGSPAKPPAVASSPDKEPLEEALADEPELVPPEEVVEEPPWHPLETLGHMLWLCFWPIVIIPAAIRGFDRLLGRLVGQDNRILHYFLRMLIIATIVLLAGLGLWLTLPELAKQPVLEPGSGVKLEFVRPPTAPAASGSLPNPGDPADS